MCVQHMNWYTELLTQAHRQYCENASIDCFFTPLRCQHCTNGFLMLIYCTWPQPSALLQISISADLAASSLSPSYGAQSSSTLQSASPPPPPAAVTCAYKHESTSVAVRHPLRASFLCTQTALHSTPTVRCAELWHPHARQDPTTHLSVHPSVYLYLLRCSVVQPLQLTLSPPLVVCVIGHQFRLNTVHIPSPALWWV